MAQEQCICKSYAYIDEVDEHYFVAEQGNRFYLKLDVTGDPPNPPDNYKVVLHKLENTRLTGVTKNSLKCDYDSVDIQIVTKQHEDTYTLIYTNSYGEASLRFRLMVDGMYMYVLYSSSF